MDDDEKEMKETIGDVFGGAEKRRAKAVRAHKERRRDEFAKAALTGILACPSSAGHPAAVHAVDYAKVAYQVADAMLAERKKGIESDAKEESSEEEQDKA